MIGADDLGQCRQPQRHRIARLRDNADRAVDAGDSGLGQAVRRQRRATGRVRGAATAIAGLALGFATGGAGMLGWHAAHAAIALVAGMLLFRIGLFGGGDAKFYAAVAAWFPLAAAPRLLISVALSGLALLVVWFVYRRATGKPISRNGDNPGDKLPYGIAIAIGALVARLALA